MVMFLHWTNGIKLGRCNSCALQHKTYSARTDRYLFNYTSVLYSISPNRVWHRPQSFHRVVLLKNIHKLIFIQIITKWKQRCTMASTLHGYICHRKTVRVRTTEHILHYCFLWKIACSLQSRKYSSSLDIVTDAAQTTQPTLCLIHSKGI